MLGEHPHYVVGVSGGGDSLALLHLMHEAGFACTAVTVDHRLRADSADEAAFVAGVCAMLAIPHRTLPRAEGADWHNQHVAREGRYDALLAVARELDAPVVVGHTLDDQAETIRMRARRGGGTLGLSGIAPLATLAGRTRLLRPLIGRTRNELRLHLLERGLDWIDDPSNESVRFERIRVRESAATHDLHVLGRFAAAARRHRAALMLAIAADLRDNLTGRNERLRYSPGVAGVALIHAVRWVAAWLGRETHLPSQARIATFLADEPALTIAGTTITKRRDSLHFAVESRRATAFRYDPERRAGEPFDRFRPASDDPVHAVLSAS